MKMYLVSIDGRLQIRKQRRKFTIAIVDIKPRFSLEINNFFAAMDKLSSAGLIHYSTTGDAWTLTDKALNLLWSTGKMQPIFCK